MRLLGGRRQELEAEKSRFVEAIRQGGRVVSLLIAELEKCAQELDTLEKRIQKARSLVQPLLVPRPQTVTDFVSGSASLFTSDPTENRGTVERVLEGLWVYADGSLLVQFQRESLFHPVRHVRLLPEDPRKVEEVAAARTVLLREVQKTLHTYQAASSGEHKRTVELDLYETPNGPPAIVAMTPGFIATTFGVGAAAPVREITRKIAFASPAGFEPALQP